MFFLLNLVLSQCPFLSTSFLSVTSLLNVFTSWYPTLSTFWPLKPQYLPLSMSFSLDVFPFQYLFLSMYIFFNILPSHWVLLSMFSFSILLFSISFLLMSFPLDVFPSQCLPLSIFSLLNVLPCQVSPSQTPISPLLKIILSQSSFLSISSSHSIFPS